MKIWLITAFDAIPTDNVRPMRFMGLANSLLKRGHSVTLWAGSFSPFNNSQRVKKDTFITYNKNYYINILKSLPYKNKISFKRLLSHRHLAKRLKNELPNTMPPDLIFISLPPLATVFEVVKFSKKMRVPIIVDIIDPWPDVFTHIFPKIIRPMSKFFFIPFYAQLKFILRNVNGISAISNTYLDWASRYGNINLPKKTSYPATKLNYKKALNKKMNKKRLRFVYAGALSNSYDVETIIKCAHILNSTGQTNLEFIIAGTGPKMNMLKKLKKGLTNVSFTGWLNSSELSNLLYTSDVGIACYKIGATQSVTYKLFDYLGAGLPIICSLPGEMDEIIEKNDIGFTYEPGNARELADIIIRIMSDLSIILKMRKRCLKYTLLNGDANSVYNELSIFLEKVAMCNKK